jgi:alpha-ketoglutaric semialdehyde dehydrogenase
MNEHGHFIGGQRVKSETFLETINPSDLSDTVGRYAEGNHDTALQAISAARAAFGTWGMSGPQQRFDVLDTAGNLLQTRREEIARLLAREEGKTLVEALGEVGRAAMVFKFFAGESLRPAGELLPSVRPGMTVEVTREPLGVVGLITPWNFPIAIPAWKIGAALACGNTVVIKPSEVAPGCVSALAQIFAEAGAPAGVINVVMGSGPIIGRALVESADVDAISFTGSVAVGRQIGAECAARGKRVQLEMGGKNPLVVIDDADIKVAVEAAVNGSFFQTGQRCTASSRLIVTEGIYDRFVNAVQARINDLRIGHALDPDTEIGPVVSERQLQQNLRYLKIGVEEGGTLHGGQLLDRPTKGYFMAPALITDTAPGMRVNREEIFGPVASVIRVKDYEEALAMANDTEFGLSAGLCTTSLRYAQHFRRNIQSGLVMINTATAGLDYHVPFGGRKGSSYGPREQGTYAREFYSLVKTAYVSA